MPVAQWLAVPWRVVPWQVVECRGLEYSVLHPRVLAEVDPAGPAVAVPVVAGLVVAVPVVVPHRLGLRDEHRKGILQPYRPLFPAQKVSYCMSGMKK